MGLAGVLEPNMPVLVLVEALGRVVGVAWSGIR